MSTTGKSYVEKLLTPYNEFPYWEEELNTMGQLFIEIENYCKSHITQ